MKSSIIFEISVLLLATLLVMYFLYTPVNKIVDLENGLENKLRFEYVELVKVSSEPYLDSNSKIIRLHMKTGNTLIQTYHYGSESEIEEFKKYDRLSSVLVYRSDDNLWFLEDYTLKSKFYTFIRYWLGFVWLELIFSYQTAIIISYLIPVVVCYLIYKTFEKLIIENPTPKRSSIRNGDNKTTTNPDIRNGGEIVNQDIKPPVNKGVIRNTPEPEEKEKKAIPEEEASPNTGHQITKIESEIEPLPPNFPPLNDQLPPYPPIENPLSNVPDLDSLQENTSNWIQKILDWFT